MKNARSSPKPTIHKLGDLQLRIMQALWSRGEAPVSAVHETLGGSSAYAYTTVATMLRKMEQRHLVAHREEGRSFIYYASVAADEVSKGMSEHFINKLFDGQLTDVVSHLLTTREVSRKELDELERLIAKRKTQL